MNKRWIIAGIIITAALAIAILVYSYIQLIQITPPPAISPRVAKHIFKIKEIYPTKPGGREWFIDMANPQADRLFDPDSPIFKEPDGSWQIGGGKAGVGDGGGDKNEEEDQVRMKVGTPEGEPEWKNIEITGYVKVLWADSPSDHLDWYARGGRHSSSVPCEGSALKGWISADGTVSWIKEIWHTGGYTKARDTHKATGSIVNRWIGWKVIMYNIDNNNKAVKMESYIDYNDNNNWRKVSEIVDNGGWFAKSLDEKFYSADCGRPKDYIMTNSGPLVTFRSDNMIWDFADLSVREIQPPIDNSLQ